MLLLGQQAGKLLRSLKEKASQWWYFLDHPQVPPDNKKRRKVSTLGGN
ncbi:MAG: hypothetical protein F6K51_07525 [Moorea sp. SIO3I8]|nr:hypothetical protein [Moorena sp. SIO3I8]